MGAQHKRSDQGASSQDSGVLPSDMKCPASLASHISLLAPLQVQHAFIFSNFVGGRVPYEYYMSTFLYKSMPEPGCIQQA